MRRVFHLQNLTNPSAAPYILLSNLTALLAPCWPTCRDGSTFHNVWSIDGQKVFFAYRVWDEYGDGIGSQALAVASADGSNMVDLTWNNTGPDQGLNIIDLCPTPTNDGSRVFFVRTVDQGVSVYAAVVDVATRTVTMLDQLPEYAQASGCPNFLPTADGLTIFYMGCVGDACGFGAPHAQTATIHRKDVDSRWGRIGGASTRSAAGSSSKVGNSTGFNYYSVSMPVGSSPSSWSANLMFEVPLTDTPDTIDSYGITQCDQIIDFGSDAVITCQGANNTDGFFQRLFVDPVTSNTSKISDNTLRACMTPRCAILQAVQ